MITIPDFNAEAFADQTSQEIQNELIRLSNIKGQLQMYMRALTQGHAPKVQEEKEEEKGS